MKMFLVIAASMLFAAGAFAQPAGPRYSATGDSSAAAPTLPTTSRTYRLPMLYS